MNLRMVALRVVGMPLLLLANGTFGQFGPVAVLGRSEILQLREIHVLEPDANGPSDLLILGTVQDEHVFALFRDAGTIVADRPDYVLTVPGVVDRHLLVDLDLDGIDDLLAAVYHNTDEPDTLRCYPGLGDGTFGAGIFITSVNTANSSPHDLAVADMNGDGLLDILHFYNKSYPLTNSVELLSGTGAFTYGPAQELWNVGYHNARLATGDLDGDGDEDVVLSVNSNQRLLTLLNDGTGQVTLADDRAAYGIADLDLHDMDADGDLDLLYGATQVYLLLNDGNAVWAPSTAVVPSLSGNYGIRDLNADGAPDIWSLTQNGIGSATFTVRWSLNNGSGGFPTYSSYPIYDQITPMAWTDVDADGQLDLLTASGGNAEGLTYSKMDLQVGTLASLERLSQSVRDVTQIATADLDGDGDLDVMVQCRADSKTAWFENNGTDYWTEHIVWEDRTRYYQPKDMLLLDADGDGDIDLLQRKQETDAQPASTTEWFLNDGTGTFVSGGTLESIWTFNNNAALQQVDLNDDGITDILQYMNGILYWQGLPGGGFAQSRYLIENWQGLQPILLGDIGDPDGDGDLDLVASCGGSLCLIENNGTEAFAPPQLFATNFIIISRTFLRDMDGDGDLDAVAQGNETRLMAAWFANEDGYFLEQHTIGGMSSHFLIAEDMDADGDVDLVGRGTQAYSGAMLWRNDGSGTFLAPTPVPGAPGTADVAIASDLDQDGSLDLLINQDDQLIGWHPGYGASEFAVQGMVFLDVNANGLQEPGEPGLPGATLTLHPNTAATTQGSGGNFSMQAEAGAYTLTVAPPVGEWLATTPVEYTFELSDVAPVFTGLSIGFAPLTNNTSVQANAAGAFPACAGQTPFWVSARNMGNMLLSGTVKCGVDPLLNYVSAQPPPDQVIGDTLVWQVSDLAPFAEWSAMVRVAMPGISSQGMEIRNGIRADLRNAANEGTVVTATNVNTITCTGATNQLICTPGGEGAEHLVPADSPFLSYTVLFRNVGADTIHTVVVDGWLQTPLRHGQVEIVAASHPASLVLTSSTSTGLSITMAAMDLPPIATDPLGSQGFVTYQVPVDTDLTVHGVRYNHNVTLTFLGAGNATAAPDLAFVTWLRCPAVPPTILDTTIWASPALYVPNVGGTYQWYLNGAPTTSGNNFIFPTTPGWYTVDIVDAFGCAASTEPYFWGTIGTAEEAPGTPSVRVYPNPASTWFTIELGAVPAPQAWGVYDMTGRCVLHIPTNGSQRMVVQRGNLASGTYLLRPLDPTNTVAAPGPLYLH